MSFKILFLHGRTQIAAGAPLDAAPQAANLEEVLRTVREGQRKLAGIGVDSLIAWLDAAAQRWLDPQSPAQREFGALGVNFLLSWWRAAHLQHVLDLSLRGNRHCLDAFTEINTPDRSWRLRAFPRGVVCHWLAGNVPLLGAFSLLQGLLTKNANLLKASRQNFDVLPRLLGALAEVEVTDSVGVRVSGRTVLESVAVVFCDSADRAAQEELSNAAQVRVAWGGREAVEAVMNLPRRYGTDDVVFGPKTSFAVIGREFLNSVEGARQIARRLARDAVVFEQRGCNSPHTVFVESGAAVAPAAFARLVAEEMEAAARRVHRSPTASAETLELLTLRAEYDMRGEAFYPDGTGWTVLFAAEDRGLAKPCYNRTLFVRPVDNVEEVAAFCSHLTQSAGTALLPERKTRFSELVGAQGIDRCPDLGAMSAYDVPWDGMFFADRLVRWSKL